ncbi:MAG: MFS transporter [Pirellulales bacterium]|nr:MFS transporter [Pirellulales bacterium]
MGDALREVVEDPEAIVVVAAPQPVARAAPALEEAVPQGARLRSLVAAKLATAMFLHHFSLGAFIVTLGNYIQANSGSAGAGLFSAGFVGIAYSAGPLGGMVAPFLTGLLADHLFATERIMCVLHVVGAAALGCAVTADSQAAFYVALIAYFVCFIPSFALVCSMTLHHLADPARDFPMVRAFSTMGWIAGGVFVGWIWPETFGEVIEATAVPMEIAMAGGLVTAAFCLFLPHTPPANRRPAAGPGGISLKETLELVRQSRFLVLIAIAVAAHAPSQFYYAYGNVYLNWLGMSHSAAKLTLGQITEVAMMFLLPLVLERISVKAAIVAGMSVWTVRFWMFAQAAGAEGVSQSGLAYAAIISHGVAFTLTSIALQLDLDRCAGRKRRATAQGLLAVAMSGIGCFIGAQAAGVAGAWLLPTEISGAGAAGWRVFWMIPAVGSAAVVLLTAFFLRSDVPRLATTKKVKNCREKRAPVDVKR